MAKLSKLLAAIACLTSIASSFPNTTSSHPTTIPSPSNLTLIDWAESRITALFQATNVPDFDNAVSAYLAKDVKLIIVNGEKLTREEYVARLHTSREVFDGATVRYIGAVEVPDENGSEESGEVGVFFKAHITENVESEGKPLTETAVCSFNMKIIQDPSLHPPQGDHRYFERRRVATLTTVYTRAQDSSS